MDIHLLFHVPEGLEFIAVKDLESTLTKDGILLNAKYKPEKKTGRIHVYCTVKDIPQLKEYMVDQVQLLCVYSVTLVASESVIPADIFTDSQATYDYILNQTKLTPWSQIISQQAASFRATFKKEHLKHTCASQRLAGGIGFAFLTVYKDWKVKMTDYQYNIIGLWYQTKEIVLLLGLELEIKHQKQRNRVFFGRTSLNPAIAYCLVKLVDPKPGQVVLDMCCGTGTIPIEGASLYKDVFWLGGEIRSNTLTEKAQGNVIHCGINNIELLLGDGRKMCYRPGVIDSIVSDWPWGIRENSYAQIKSLYPKFMKQMWIALKTNGKAYIVTQGHKIMSYVFKYDWCDSMWNTNEIIPIGIGGLDVYLYILSKKPNPSFVPQDIYMDVYPLSLSK